MMTVYWSGTLEHDKLAPGLSCYTAGSQLLTAIERDDLKPESRPKRHGERGEDRAPRAKGYQFDGMIAALLKKGVSYGAISRQLGVSFSPVRRVAKKMKAQR